MARQARFVVPGQVHWVALPLLGAASGPGGGPGPLALRDDRTALLQALQRTVQEQRMPLHAYALAEQRVELLLSPAGGEALATFVQALGRRFVGPYNRRHGRSGALWSSRYRCAALEPGDTVLLALCALCLSGREEGAEAQDDCAAHYLGQARLPWLTDLLDYWRLANEPFARQAQLRALLQAPELPERVGRLRTLAARARALGSQAFLQALERHTGQALLPRRRGRPRKPAP